MTLFLISLYLDRFPDTFPRLYRRFLRLIEYWWAVKYLSKQQSSIPTLMDEDGNEALTGAQKADMLNKFFSKCFNCRSAPLEAWSESELDLPVNPRMSSFAVKIQYVSY